MKIITYSAGLALVAGFMLTGCNAVTGGPSNADIEAAAREQMAAGAGPEMPAAIKAAIDAATIEPEGICNSLAEAGKHVCAVKVTSTLPGATQETTENFVVKLSKGSDGKWAAVD